MNTNTAPTAPAIDRQSTSVVPTRTLLIAGAVAGPTFVAVATAQVLLRDGFDLRRHPLSQLATGGVMSPRGFDTADSSLRLASQLFGIDH